MDIQTRKIEFIQEFLKLKNEDLLCSLENLLNSYKSREEDFKPMTVSEFRERIEKSVEDAENEKLTSSNDLLNQIEKWA